MEGDKWRPASDPRDPGPRVRQGSDAAAQAPVERLQIVPDTLVVRVLGLSLGQILEGAAEIAAHQVRVAAIVEEFGARARQPQRVGVGAVRETEALQLVVGGRKPEPRLGIALRALHGAPEVHLGETVVLGSIMLLAERQVVLRVAGRARGGRRRLDTVAVVSMPPESTVWQAASGPTATKAKRRRAALLRDMAWRPAGRRSAEARLRDADHDGQHQHEDQDRKDEKD